MRTFTLMLLGLMLALPALGAESVVKLNAGVNGVWYRGATDLPDDYEVGVTAPVSLSPHLGFTTEAWYGVQEKYWRAAFGPHAVITDGNSKDFSAGVGIVYQVSSEPEVRPEEWAAKVTMGWRPLRQQWPRVTLGLAGWRGLETEQTSVQVAARLRLLPAPQGGE